MKVRVKQAHAIPINRDGEIVWIDHPVGQELDIKEKEFCGNLHEKTEAEPLETKKSAKPETKKE